MKVNFTLGYGQYAQQDLKEFQNQFLDEFPVEPKITESFPPYWYYDASINYLFNDRLSLGISGTYGSSAGRMHYKDYTGEIMFDVLANYFSIGIPVGFKLNPQNETWQLAAEVTPSIVLSNVDLEFQSRLGTQEERESFKFNSLNVALQPAVALSRKIQKFGLNVLAGYNLTVLKGDVFYKEQDDAYLLNESGEKVKIDWSGFRVGLGISYFFDWP
jgi:hypothetical protein